MKKMVQYKKLSERPVIDNPTSERYMNFEVVLSKSEKTIRRRRTRNTVLISALILAGILMMFYLTREQKSFFQNSIQPGKSSKKDTSQSLPGNPDSNSRELNAIPIDTSDTIKPEEKLKSPIRSTSGNIRLDTFKVKESFQKSQQYIPASPVVGFDSLYQYFNEKLKYPENMMKKKITGEVVIQFSIKKNGDVGEVKVIQQLYPLLDSIAVATVKNMPPWKPALVNGVTVMSSHSVPLVFRIDSLSTK